MATKILLTKNNTKLNIDNSNVYSFDNETIKEQFINKEYFNGESYKTLLDQANERGNVWIDSISISFKMTPEETGYSNLELLNKNYCIVLEKGKEYFFFITEASKINENVVLFNGNLDIFMTYEIKTMFKGDIEINSGQVKRYDNSGMENNFSFSENEEINDTWESYDKTHQLEPITTFELKKIYKVDLEGDYKYFYDNIVSKTLWVYLKLKQTGDWSFKVYNSPNISGVDNDYIEIQGQLYVAPLNQEHKSRINYNDGSSGTKQVPYDVAEMIKVAGRANIESMYISNMVPFPIEKLDIFKSGNIVDINEKSNDYVIFQRGSKEVGGCAIRLKQINPYRNSIYNVKKLDLTNEGYEKNDISNKAKLDNETGARHNKQFHISSIYSDNTFKIPPYLYGKNICFRTLTTNFDGNEETFLKIDYTIDSKTGAISQLNYGTGIGFKENINTMIPAANKEYEEMRINNKSSLALKSASSFLGLLAAPAVAYKKPMAGIGMAFGAVSFGAKIADMKRAPSNITNFSADVIHKYGILGYFKYFNCVVKQPTGNALEMKQWDCVVNGSKINVLSSKPFISERYYFNKIDYSNVYSNINLDISHKGKQIITDSCESGDLTVWHVRDLNTFKGIKNYEYENLEMEKYEKHKK